MLYNQSTLLEMASNYENGITNMLAAALNVETKSVQVKWSTDRTIAKADLSNNDTILMFNFIYTEDNLRIETESYKILFNDKKDYRQLAGIQSMPVSIDLTTLTRLHAMFKEILNREYTMNDNAPSVAATDESESI